MPEFAAFRYNSSQWPWAIVINDSATDAVVFYGGAGGAGYTSLEQVAALPSVSQFSGTFSLARTATLNFMQRDWSLSDNAGGASVYIESVPVACGPAAVGSQGGVEEPDGQLDNSDFIVFIGRYFAGC